MTNTNTKLTKHRIFGISGCAQSGKSTLAQHIKDNVDNVKIIHFADYLKKVLKDLFGLDDYYLNDDKGKNELTHLKWEDMPGVVDVRQAEQVTKHSNQSVAAKVLKAAKIEVRSGYMTGREVMEYFGTGIVRRMFEDAWVNATIKQMASTSKPTNFIIADVRSSNEIAKLFAAGGFVVRLTRDEQQRDTKIERQLDKDQYNWRNFDEVIDNTDLSVDEKNQKGLIVYLQLFPTLKS